MDYAGIRREYYDLCDEMQDLGIKRAGISNNMNILSIELNKDEEKSSYWHDKAKCHKKYQKLNNKFIILDNKIDAIMQKLQFLSGCVYGTCKE